MLYLISFEENRYLYVAIPPTSDAEKLLNPPIRLKRVIKLVEFMNLLFFASIVLVVFIGHSKSPEVFWKRIFLPLIGISFAWTVFVSRSFNVIATYIYKRRVHKYEKAGQLVIVPQGLVGLAKETCKKLNKVLPNMLFSYDLKKTLKLCNLYQKNRQLPEVQKQLELLIHSLPKSKIQNELSPTIRKYDLHVKGVSNLFFYLSSLMGL